MFTSLSLGGSFASCFNCSPPLQDKKRAQGSACQAQGVSAGEGQARGGEGQEAQGGTEKTVPRHGPDGPEKTEVQPEGGDAGRLSDFVFLFVSLSCKWKLQNSVCSFSLYFLEALMKISCKDMTIKSLFHLLFANDCVAI